ncbi:hypothetical protein JN11_01106 [Mucilaginibacter frigoritolerans]|uniref:Uncharacterized protein n=1 Tax=Mucilaginibacter frigoritolerans TaxID=652788 RepID=A0A562UCI5_9SPHI|nr:hypothetical protein [Mucilaginibacter frigoritolerans]TWJ03560.1 hypothetical protein JN11_01106 [Mucilaginibacter frigoritolerans]
MGGFKKAIKLVFIVLLIILASVGICFGGGLAIPFSEKREDTNEARIELVDYGEKKTSNADEQYK